MAAGHTLQLLLLAQQRSACPGPPACTWKGVLRGTRAQRSSRSAGCAVSPAQCSRDYARPRLSLRCQPRVSSPRQTPSKGGVPAGRALVRGAAASYQAFTARWCVRPSRHSGPCRPGQAVGQPLRDLCESPDAQTRPQCGARRTPPRGSGSCPRRKSGAGERAARSDVLPERRRCSQPSRWLGVSVSRGPCFRILLFLLWFK